MNSIFFRIYAGILIMVLIIGALAYGSIKTADYFRAKSYRQSMAHGTFYLIAQGLSRYPGEKAKKNWLEAVSRLVGAKVSLANADTLSLSTSEKSLLANNKVLLRLNNKKGYANIIYATPDGSRYIHTRMSKVSEQQARATAMLVMDALGHHPAEKWQTVTAKLQKQFGFSLSIQPFAKIQLDKEQTQRLVRHEVVLAIGDNDKGSKSSVTVYSSIGKSGKVLVMGPLYLFDPYPVEMLSIIGLISLLLLALAAYLLVRPLQNRLGHLERVIKRVGKGDLEARAEVGHRDAIGQLANTFNGMGRHIRRLIESQREMTRAVSHELRTPVARLRFGLEMLPDCQGTDELMERLKALDLDIEQLDSLIDEILTFAKLEEGTPSLEFESIYFPDLFQQMQQELQPIHPDVSIEVDDDSWRQLPVAMRHASGERRYMHRILQNLVNNGCRYGHSRVRMRFYLQGELACVEVDDDGEGIPESERKRIFEPFARLDKSRQQKSGGYGLGLSIVQRIAEWHGGYIDIASSDMGGARFRVLWPRLRRSGRHALSATS